MDKDVGGARALTKQASDVTEGSGTKCSFTPGLLSWRDVAGAGLQISTVLPAGFKISGTAREWDGKTSVMTWTVRDQITVQIADERWVQFSSGSWDEMQRAYARLFVASPDLFKALDVLVNAKALSKVRSLVAGWNGEDRDKPYNERHPSKLGATLPKTNCGAVYELDEAMQAARAAIRKAQPGDTVSADGTSSLCASSLNNPLTSADTAVSGER